AAAVGDRLAPAVIIDLAVHLAVDAAHADAVAADAGEVGLAAGADAEAAVERVVPHVELGAAVGVHGRDEVDGRDRLAVGAGDLVGDIDHVFVGADAVVGGDAEVRQAVRAVLAGHLADDACQPRGGVGRPADGALFLGPAQGVQPEGG